MNSTRVPFMTFLAYTFVFLMSVSGQRAMAERIPDLWKMPESGRTLEFKTTEGTWMSLDVFPDSGDIVFELLGDFYVVPQSGGAASSLTTGPAFDSQPVVSPDGKHIAFVSDRSGAENLWVMDANGGAPRQVSDDHWGMFASPVWRPDGKSIFVSRTNRGIRSGYEIVEYSLQGDLLQTYTSHNKTFVPDDQISAMGADFSPDGKYLFYALRKGRHPRRVTLPVWHVRRLNMVTGEDVEFITEQGGAFRPRISPDGKWLTYGTRLGDPEGPTTLKAVNLANGKETVLLTPLDHDDQESEDFNRDIIPGYAFTADGKAVIFPTGGNFKKIKFSGGEVQEINFVADVKVDLANVGPPRQDNWSMKQKTARLIQQPSLSPDNTKLLFSTLSGIYLHTIENKSTIRLETQLNAFQPVWSPDGNSFAYVTWTPNAGGEVWRQSLADGVAGAVKITTETAFYADLLWTRSDEIVAVYAPLEKRLENTQKASAPIEGLELLALSTDGQEVRRLMRASGNARYYNRQIGDLHQTAENGVIYMNTADGLVSLNMSTRLVSNVAKIFGPADFDMRDRKRAADDIIASPDGQLYLAKVKEQLFLVPAQGGHVLNIPSAQARQISRYGVDYFGWSSDGSKIFWTLGTTLYIFDVAALNGADLPEEMAIRQQTEALKLNIPLTAEGPEKKARLLLTRATILPMTGEEPITGKSILVEGDRIAAIVPDSEALSDADIKVIDLRGKYILPGFIDLHAHFSVIGRGGVLDDVVAPFLANLAYGITTIRDPQSFTTDMFAYQDLADAGMIVTPRIFTTGPGIQSDLDFGSDSDIRDTLTKFRDFYKTRTVKFYLAGNRRQERTFITVANDMGLYVTSEATRNFKWDLSKILDGIDGQEHPIPHAPLYNDILTVIAQTDLTYTPVLAMSPTRYDALHAWEADFRQQKVSEKLARFVPPNIINDLLEQPDGDRTPLYFREQAYVARQIVEKGGRVGVGAHALRNLQGLRYHWEMWTLNADGDGMTPMEVLTAATISGAEALGLQDQLGSIEEGKLADLIVLEKDPTADIKNTDSVLFTLVKGTLYDSATIEALWPIRKPAPHLWWYH